MNLPQKVTLYLMVSPEQTLRAGKLGLPLAHMAYRVGSGPHLFRSQSQALPRGGLMVLEHRGFDGRGDPESLFREVLRECTARGFSGVFWDFEGPAVPNLKRAAESLSPLLIRQGRSLYLPECCAPWAPAGSKLVISTAISGGSLAQRLSEAAERYGADRVVLGLERASEDFTLPALTGSGTPLNREALDKLRRERSPSIYFSDELCAHYFTYMRPGERAHFILFDDGASLCKKLHIAADLGLREAFLPYEGNDDLMEELAR